MYQIKNLEHRYGQTPVLHIDGLSMDENTITGLIGANGSGKTTLLKLLAFIEKPSQGEIRFLDRPGSPFSDNTRLNVSLLTQEPYLMRRSVYENVFYGLKIRKKAADAPEKIRHALSWVGLSPEKFLKRHFSQLSGGEAQRVALAARLVLKPRALLLDEPTANVDAHSAALIRKAVLRAKNQWGTTLIIASHDQQWLYEICDSVLLMNSGRIAAAGKGNLIEGPWHSGKNGRWEKILKDGQRIIVPQPPHENAIALIHFRTSNRKVPQGTEDDSEVQQLMGMVTRMIYNRKTQEVVTTVTAAGISLTFAFTGDQAAGLELMPGRNIMLTYRTSRISWA